LELVIDLAPEIAVVEQARRGDRRAFAAVHARYAPMVHAILLAKVPPREAEDLVQDVFLKALEKIHTLKEAASIGPWLCALARNRAADFHRRLVPLAKLPEQMTAPRSARLDAREVLEAVRGLPETYRETMLMRLVEGMTGPEIARATGMTPGSVRVHLHRGMKILREHLGREENR
jgi:RNA polymerase sigma-70 factor (ECF subfamily)